MVREKNKFVKVCPRCGSRDVYSNPVQYLDPNILKCKNCGYNGIILEVEDKSLKEVQKRLIKNRKAQLKIQETAFMLLALALLFALLFIFYSNYQVKNVYSAKNKLLEEQAISLLSKFMAMPEFSCMHGNCIDEDKLYALRNMSAYDSLWKGIAKIQVVRIYPKQEIITIYQAGNPEMSYASFVPLCRTMQQEGYIWQQCSLAKLLVSIEKISLERKK